VVCYDCPEGVNWTTGVRMPEYSLRQATYDDYEFLYELHAATMREYVEATWGWQEAWQQEYFARKFDPDVRQIIQIDDQDAGVIVIEERDEELFISLIEIDPKFQNRGVGSILIQRYIDAAHDSGQPVTLHVLKSNRPARRLYERLGFAVIAEEKYRYKMACSPEEWENKDEIQNNNRTIPHKNS
jgi:ribosomal protein S18 acetylase RimI-like enzyme